MMARTAMIEPLLSSFPRVTIWVPCWKSCNISLSGKINMSRIAFRPTKDRLGGYCFSIDAIGHVEDERIADALKGLYRSSRMMIFLRFYQKCLHKGFLPR
ncbi:hypothetical protein JCM18909_4096 [Cutibacterium acnes JCM 18909]|nr:hypothetical protein JCM18909_4096 [Cutibacterium acnes JCM 18909]